MKTDWRERRRRKKDQLFGAIAFIPRNVFAVGISAVIAINDPSLGAILPWAVNTVLLVVALLRWPYFALGYLAAFLGLIVGGVAFVVFAVVAGFAPALLAMIPVVGPVLAFVAWIWALLWGLRRGYRWSKARFDRWWDVPGEPESNRDIPGAVRRRFDPDRRRLQDDANTLQQFHRGDLELGDDGELRPAEKQRKNKE
jgi:hypothetical protein